MKQGKIWFVIQIATSVCCVIAGIVSGVLGIFAILEMLDVRYAIMGILVCTLVSGINCAIAVCNLKRIKNKE